MQTRTKYWVSYVLLNFATPIAFFLTFRTLGSKPAIALAVVTTCLQLLAHWVQSLPLSPFLLVSSSFTILFGVTDLVLARPQFFRLQPFAQNFILGTAFLMTLIFRIPLMAWFAEALPQGWRPDPASVDPRYLRRVTAVWVVYLYAKAALFLYLAFRVDLGALVIYRTVIGGGSLVLLFFGEIIYRKWFRHWRGERHSEAA